MPEDAGRASAASLRVERPEAGHLVLVVSGRLDSQTTAPVWRDAVAALERDRPGSLVVDAAGVTYCDDIGIGLLIELRRRQRRSGRAVAIRNLAPPFQALLDLFPAELLESGPPPRRHVPVLGLIGQSTERLYRDLQAQLAFRGELAEALGDALIRPWRLRWNDTIEIATAAGADAVPIAALHGILIGLILAFQSAIALKAYGAEQYVSHLVAITVVRELGPLITAVLMAGRTGAAFAAELGTMRVNEEVDALLTMGLSPIRFLVLPRVLATLAAAPLLTLFTELMALAGSGVVVMSFGLPPIAYLQQISGAFKWEDWLGGLAKTPVFGMEVALIGCLRGLQARTGAASVGEAATRAVVSGIVLIILIDGLFAVLYYALGI